MSNHPTTNPAYRGRFAPSPTGPLHFGSLIAALASYLEAKSHGGRWEVRIDDIDPPREVPGAAADILHTLEAYGFEWDGPVHYQAQNLERYAAALRELITQGQIYACACSRKEIAQHPSTQLAPPGFYPGTCIKRGLGLNPEYALRLIVANAQVNFLDQIQGQQICHLAQTCGDFILRRNDGLYSYQFATAVDDALDGYSHILRGSDLLESTPRQIFVQQALGYAAPQYGHLPIATNQHGEKLSKQTHARPLVPNTAVQAIWQALDFLGQAPPVELSKCELRTIWEWGQQFWDSKNVPHLLQQRVTSLDQRETYPGNQNQHG